MTAECAPLDNVLRPGAPNGPSGIALSDRRFVGQINLRVRGAAVRAVSAALGYALPIEANTVAGNDASRACWLGPDEWLLICEDTKRAELKKRLDDALTGHAYAATDITDSRAVLRIAGVCARPVLAKGCPLDLHSKIFGVGRVAQSVVGKAQAMILPIDGGGYDLFVSRSFAGYLWSWLLDAGAEYGIRVEG